LVWDTVKLEKNILSLGTTNTIAKHFSTHMNNLEKPTNDYRQWLIDLKTKIRQSQIKAAVREMAKNKSVIIMHQLGAQL